MLAFQKMVKKPHRAKNSVFLDGPFWSHAHNAWRVERREYDPQDNTLISESSFFCSDQAHAEELAREARKDPSVAGWEATREIAVAVASNLKGDAFLYRIMSGVCETYRGKPVRYAGGYEGIR